jgi:hypothetical protein
MLACARLGAPHSVVFGGFSAEALRSRIDDAEAKLVITADGGYRRGGVHAAQARRRRGRRGDAPRSRRCSSSSAPARTTSSGRGPRRLVARHRRRGEPEHTPEAFDSEHPLFILYTSGHDREAQGHPAHHRRLPHPGAYTTQRVRPAPRVRRLLVHRRRRLGHRPQLHRLRPAGERRDPGDVRGHPGHPAQGPLVGDRREVQGDDPLHRAHGDPHVHEVGPRHPGEVRPVVAAPARLGRRADQPRGVDVVPQVHRRRALPDRRHLVADRDRRHHDQPAARASPPLKPGSAQKPLPGIGARSSTTRGKVEAEKAATWS